MKRIMTLSLAVALLCVCLAGCGGAKVDLTGRWEAVSYYSSESILEEFEAFDLYDEEIALLDPAAMGLCDVLELNADLTYTITYDAEKSRALVEEYYRDAFDTFFQHRAELESVYNEDFSAMGEAEFRQFYADMYGAADFEELISMFVGEPENYAHLEENPEVGTYRVFLNQIYFTVEGSSEEEYVTFRIPEEGSLTIEYIESTLTYTKAE